MVFTNIRTKAEVDAAKTNSVLLKRKERYKAESDPLYMEWQFDGTPVSEQKWRDKVEQIKIELPLP